MGIEELELNRIGNIKENKRRKSLTQGETRNWIEDIKGKRKKNKAWSMERLETELRILKENERRTKLGQWRDLKLD